MKIQIDVLNRDDLIANPELVYTSELEVCSARKEPADLLSLIVLQADGTIVPISYSFSEDFQICNSRNRRLGDAWSGYFERGYLAFRRLCRRFSRS